MRTALAENLEISPAAYLAGEKIAKLRHEYVNGQVLAMAGGTKAHNQVAGNVYSSLRAGLRGTPCRVFIGDVKVYIAWDWHQRYYYPDVVVACESGDNDAYVIEQPKLIIEVLSESTERNDRSDKFYAYRRLPSLQEYVLVAQDSLRVEVYRRETGWDLEVYQSADAQFSLSSVDLSLTVLEVYEGLSELLVEAGPVSSNEVGFAV